MTRTQVHRLVQRLGIREGDSDVNGIVIHREGKVAFNAGPGHLSFWGAWVDERWRLSCGSGIAGQSGVWKLVRLPSADQGIGDLRTLRSLERTLRKWRKWEEP